MHKISISLMMLASVSLALTFGNTAYANFEPSQEVVETYFRPLEGDEKIRDDGVETLKIYNSKLEQSPYNKCENTHHLLIKNSTGEHICVSNVEKLVERKYAEFYLDHIYDNRNALNITQQELVDAGFQKLTATKAYKIFESNYDVTDAHFASWVTGALSVGVEAQHDDSPYTASLSLSHGYQYGTSMSVHCKFFDGHEWQGYWSFTTYIVWDTQYEKVIDTLENKNCFEQDVNSN